ncbi:hypothetical protein PHLCEN_2v1449, partial [Hermanssonia centrifuga]
LQRLQQLDIFLMLKLRAKQPRAAEGREKRMQEYEKQSQIDPMDTVARPGLVKQGWNTQLSRVGLRMSSRK